MKLSRKTEWMIVAVLIAYIAFAPGFAMVRDMLSSPVGKAVALAGIAYVWKTVSPLIAVLLVVLYLKCTRMSVWEGFSGAEDTCLCAGEGYTWDAGTKKCTNKDGKEGEVKSCTCISGYSWDGGPKGTKQCVPTSSTQPPLPPTPPPALEAVTSVPSAAPAVSTGPVTSTAPMTTPSAVQDMVVSAGPQMPASGGVQPTNGAATASVPAPM
jgi:hypothetical protein